MTRSVFSERYARLRTALVDSRKAAGLTQAALGNLLGRPQSFVSKYERGERRLDVVELLDVLHCLELDACKLVRELSRP